MCGGVQAVQEVKALRSQVTAREKERAERATLVQQEALNTRVQTVSVMMPCCRLARAA